MANEEDKTKHRELNQPIETLQPCGEREEPWTTGICSCTDDADICFQGLFCPCVLFGRNVEALGQEDSCRQCVCHAVFVEGGIALCAATGVLDGMSAVPFWSLVVIAWSLCAVYAGHYRGSLQHKYHLQDSPYGPCVVHCVLHQCALCQEQREIKERLAAVPTTVVVPPPPQEMIKETPLANATDDASYLV